MDQRLYKLFLDSLIGNQVKNEQGECLGQITELVIDPDSGHVKNVVLSLGESPNFGSALSAIPWEALKISRPGELQCSSAAGNGSGTRDKSPRGKPEPSSHFSAYTFPVRRFQ